MKLVYSLMSFHSSTLMRGDQPSGRAVARDKVRNSPLL